jgi:AAA+ superfamily predicted ATPase
LKKNKMKGNVPTSTQLLVKGTKLKNEFKALSSIIFENKKISAKKEEIVGALLADVCFVLDFFDKNETDNVYEYLLTFIIVVECIKVSSKEDDSGIVKMDALSLVANWNEHKKNLQELVIGLLNKNKRKIEQGQTISLLKECNSSGIINDEEFEKIKNSLRIFLFNFSYSIISIDGEITPGEKEAIDHYNNFISSPSVGGATSSNTQPKNNTNAPAYSGKPQRNFEDIMVEIEELVGMDNVKTEIRQLINFVKVNKLREERGLSKVEISLHTVFSGPPGTGKTTVARLLAEAFKTIGILKSGHLVETDRSSLVAGYVGQTAMKTKDVLESALDGLLFIDEAYMLSSGEDGYGQEAIDTILKYMEDNRSRLIVIAAGYENEMLEFVNSNPGLKSRFNKYINFENYSPAELLEIFIRLSKKNKFTLTESAKSLVFTNLSDTCLQKENFGNARYVRNLFESIIQKQFERVAYINNPSEEELSTIEEKDIVF